MELAGRSIRYARETSLSRELRRRVDEHMTRSGLPHRGGARMYRKGIVVAAWFVLSYLWAVFWASTWLEGLLAVISLGLASAAIPMCLSHDGCHGAFSDNPWINGAAAWAAGLIGIAYPWWVIKHNTLHHGYTRMPGIDDDLDQGVLFRMHPALPRRAIHRWQHVYAFFLYPFLHAAIGVTGLRFLATAKVGPRQFRRPTTAILLKTLATTLATATIFFVIPCLVREPWMVVLYGLLWSMIIGMVLVLIFQAEHCVGEVVTPPVDMATGVVSTDWTRAQVLATQGYGHRNRFLTWYSGALNFHVEHHLFPRISHVYYPDIAPVVAATCAEFGLPYNTQPTFLAALAAHVRWMKRLGREDVT